MGTVKHTLCGYWCCLDMDSVLHAMSCLLQSPGPGLDDTFSDFTNPHTVRSPEPEVLRQQLTDYTPGHLAATESVFFSLPAELRLMVYDRVFALPAASASDMVELEDAAKQFPICSLLRTCKAINIEAKCYLKAYKKQWDMAAFIISNPYRNGFPQLLQALPIGACNAISRIRISGSGHELEYGVDHLTRSGDGWEIRPFSAPVIWRQDDGGERTVSAGVL